jgi:hypothetical protein
MKILFVDCYHNYLNPTSGLVPALFVSAAKDVCFYGPGYSSEEELKDGIRAYVDRTGPYDGLVLGMQVPLYAWDDDRLLRNALHVQNYNAFGSPVSTLLPFFKDVLANVGGLPIPHRFISLLNFDYYVTTPRHTAVFEELRAFVITPGVQFAPSPEELPDWAWQERHFVRKKSMISNAWIEFLRRWPDRVLSLPHFVADSEFSFRGLAERRHVVSIPGIEYVMRKKGRETLKARGFRPAGKPTFTFLRIADRLGLRLYSKYPFLKLYHAAYQGSLIDTRFAYTAREGYGIPVRKFFEIPAAGAVMLCLPPIGFSELGFRDGENYLEVTPDDVPDAIESLMREPERAQAIASAGRKLVLERHSLAARTGQLAQCLDAIEAGAFGGSAWKQGEFQMLARQDARPAPLVEGAVASSS